MHECVSTLKKQNRTGLLFNANRNVGMSDIPCSGLSLWCIRSNRPSSIKSKHDAFNCLYRKSTVSQPGWSYNELYNLITAQLDFLGIFQPAWQVTDNEILASCYVSIMELWSQVIIFNDYLIK